MAAFLHGTRPAARLVAGVVACCVALLVAGCGGSGAARDDTPPDQRYGHRYADTGPDGRETLTVTAPEAQREYNRFPVPTEEVIVRAQPFEEGEEAVPVEVLIKGALPNRCQSLSEAEQEREGHLLYLDFQMRWPVGPGAGCERLRRPYRFYLPLEGRFRPGDYTLKINGTTYPFSVRRG